MSILFTWNRQFKFFLKKIFKNLIFLLYSILIIEREKENLNNQNNIFLYKLFDVILMIF